jgi:hypothetical protein
LLVGDQAPIHDVRDASFQRSEGFFFGFAFSEFLVEVAAAWCVEPDLGDGSHVDGVVQFPVATQRQPMPGLAPG